MNAPLTKVLTEQIPSDLLRRHPAAKFAAFDDGQLMIAVGDTVVMLAPDDIRRLDRFMGVIGGGE